MWQGSLATVPVLWALCDGNNGTPDLRDRFVLAAGAASNPDDTGGSVDHNHDLTTNGHIHNIVFGPSIKEDLELPGPTGRFLNLNTDTATTSTDNQLPPWYSIAYIMYLGA
jgi:hypothetical protein